MSTTQFDSNSVLLAHFFSSDNSTCLRIPHYQRGYSWKKEHVSQFLSDLMEQSEFTDQYYFGTFTTIGKDLSSLGVFEYELIDGQQRATTSQILLICIRDMFAIQLSALTDEINKEIFNMDLDKTREEHYKLILDDDDNLFFRDNIVNFVPSPTLSKIDHLKSCSTPLETHTNLRDSYIQIFTELSNELDKKQTVAEKNSYLNLLRSTLRKKFVISSLGVEKASHAYVMFNRMNDRGLKLAPTDLAKDLILSKINEEITAGTGTMTLDDAIRKWRDFEQKSRKSKSLMNSYLHHYLVTYHSQENKKFTFHPNSKTFHALEAILSTKIMTGGQLLDHLTSKFINYSEIKKAPQTAHPLISEKAKENLGWIKKLKIQIVQPPLLAGLEHYTKEDFEKLTDVLLKWFFRVKTVANKNASALEVELATLAYGIQHENLPINDYDVKIMKHDAKGNPIEETVKMDGVINRLSKSPNNISSDSFETLLKEITFSKDPGTYVLTKIIENDQKQKITDVVPSNKITLEHIMPQKGINKEMRIPKMDSSGNPVTDSSGNPVTENFTWLEYIKKQHGFTDDRDAKSFVQNYMNKLGNLTLINKQKNSSIGTNPFNQKCDAGLDSHGIEKGCFKNSLIKLNQEILKYSVWNKDNIQKRQNDLASKCSDIWEISI
jgi:uncharacterized protein with ParB-like and HNH nuclease domain